MALIEVKLADLVKVLKGTNSRGAWSMVVVSRDKQFDKTAVDVAVAEGCEVIEVKPKAEKK